MSLAHIRVLRDEGATHIFELGRQMRDWLDPDAWAAADLDTRIQYAIDAHGWIRSSFGEPPKPLLFEDLPSGVTGGFDPRTGEVLADPDVLLEGDPLELLKTLAHENRHDLQDRAVRAARQQRDETGSPTTDPEVQTWVEAEDTYTVNDHHQYRYNAMEVDARAAESALERGFLRRHLELSSDARAPRTVARTIARSRLPHRRSMHRPTRERGG